MHSPQRQLIAISQAMRASPARAPSSNSHKCRCREDNIMRKHNFIPLMFTTLRLLAQRGGLQPLIDRARAPP